MVKIFCVVKQVIGPFILEFIIIFFLKYFNVMSQEVYFSLNQYISSIFR